MLDTRRGISIALLVSSVRELLNSGIGLDRIRSRTMELLPEQDARRFLLPYQQQHNLLPCDVQRLVRKASANAAPSKQHGVMSRDKPSDGKERCPEGGGTAVSIS